MATVRPENTPILGILQPQLAAANNSSRAFAQAPGWHTDQHPAAREGLHTQEDHQHKNQDARHVLWLHEAAERHVPARKGLK